MKKFKSVINKNHTFNLVAITFMISSLVLVNNCCESLAITKNEILEPEPTRPFKAISRVMTDMEPQIGAYRKNFKGVVTEVLSEKINSEITLPYLNVEDNFYFGKTIQLNCNASFPIQWVYSGQGAPVVHAETFRLAPDFYKPETYLFQASVVFSHTHEKQTGNYSCQGINKPELTSYFYVFVPGNTTTFLETQENEGVKTLYVNAKSSDAWIILPCAVSDPQAKVQLYKYLTNDTLEHLEPNQKILYDPTKGFTIKANYKTTTDKDVYGKYVCSTEHDNRAEKLTIHVLPLKENDEDNEVPSTAMDSLDLEYDKRHGRIVCCNEKKKEIPQIMSTGCESVSDCNIKKKYLRSKPCPGACEQHVIKVNESCAAYELSETRDAGILECVDGENVVFHQFSKENDVIITEFNDLPPLGKILTLMKEDVAHSSKERDRYVCHANSFFFSTGLKMAWENPDGTMEFIDEFHFPLSNSIEVDANHNMTTLHCFAPVWDSATAWKNVSIFVQ